MEATAIEFKDGDVFRFRYSDAEVKRADGHGAQMSAQRMLQEVREKEADINRDIQHGIRTIADLAVLRSQLEKGDLSRKPWW